MALKSKSLVAQLDTKAADLRATQAERSAASIAFIAQSEVAATQSVVAKAHAEAVEQAISILDAAGVTL